MVMAGIKQRRNDKDEKSQWQGRRCAFTARTPGGISLRC